MWFNIKNIIKKSTILPFLDNSYIKADIAEIWKLIDLKIELKRSFNVFIRDNSLRNSKRDCCLVFVNIFI